MSPNEKNGLDNIAPAHHKTNGTEDGSGNGEPPAAPPAYNASEINESVADGRTPEDFRDPPAEEDIAKVKLTEAFDRLSLRSGSKFPDVDTCLAHLKLLFAIQSMKEDVGYTDGLWNIWDTRAGDSETDADLHGPEEGALPESGPAMDDTTKKRLAVLSKIREKRWAIFLARAVDRYEAWWASMQRPGTVLTETDFSDRGSKTYDRFVSADDHLLAWDASNLPPLGE
jgi:hypothetical protein